MAQNTTANANVNITTNTSQAEAQITQLEGSIRVLDGAVNLVGGTLETVAGGLAITGALSKEQAEQFEGLAVGAIAFADGAKRTLDGVVNLQEGFTKLAASSKFAATASRLLGAAIRFATGPIGITIAAVGALIGILVTFKDSLGVVGDVINNIIGAFTKLTDAIGITNSAQDAAIAKSKEAVKQGEFELEALKAAGATREQLVAKERQLLKDKIASEKAGSDEQKKAVQDLFLFNEKTRTENRTAEQKDADERAKKTKAATDKRLADAKTANELYKSQLEKFNDEEVDLLAKTDEERLKIEFDRTIREINALKLSEERKTQLRLEAEQNYNIKLNALLDTQAEGNTEKEIARIQANFSRILELQQLQADTIQEKRNADLATLQSQYDIEYAEAVKNGEDLTALDALYAEKRKQINDQANKDEVDAAEATADALLRARTELALGIGAAIGALGALFREGTAAAKTAALAEIAIGTAVGFINALDIAQKSAKGTGPAAAFAFPIFYATQIAAVLGAVASAKQILASTPGGSGGGGTPKPSIPSTGGGAFTGALPGTGGAPASGVPATGGGGNQTEPIRAYVIAQDVSTSQEANSAINRRRRLGPG
jgi:hypothetical protein